MTASPTPASTPCPQVQHKYGTRKRQNSVIRPSARLRECDSPSPLTLLSIPRRIKPLGSLANNSNNLPFLQLRCIDTEKSPIVKEHVQEFVDMSEIEFPPKNVVLHPDDATNKTFLAIGRAFMSVNNRAMTVKDMAELSMKHGLVCQNVSAAGQAITSFIRNHLHRCDVEQDFPLLLRHVLSGTSRDDSLAPALYSRTGGNIGREKGKDSRDRTSVQDENQSQVERLTSFRRGTTVWYLSKVAGAACPFARCGIALRDYVDIAPDASADPVPHDVSSLFSPCLKRKRQRDGLRSCHVESGTVDVAEQPRPPKVRLTLKLKPSSPALRQLPSSPVTDPDLSDRDDDLGPDDSSPPQDCLPPYPIQRRISIPIYTPCEDVQAGYFELPPPPRMFTHPASPLSHRRSPSVPTSIASPPPDSEGDDDLLNSRINPRVKLDSDLDWDWDSSDDADDMWTPERDTEDTISMQQIAVKQEDSPDSLDSLFSVQGSSAHYGLGSSARILQQKIKLEQIEPNVSFAADVPVSAVKSELDDDLWPSSISSHDPDRDLSLPLELQIKQESIPSQTRITESDHEDAVVVSSESPSPDDLPPASSRDMKWAWRDVELLGPDSVDVEEFENDWDEPMFGPSSPSPVHFYPDPCGSDRTSSSEDLVPAYTPPLTPSSPLCSTSTRTWSSPEAEPFSPVTSFAQMSLHTISQRGYHPYVSDMGLDEEVVRPCKPCGPLSILVTRIEGVLVYRIPAAQCLRRVIDDSVYLPAISQFLDSSPADGLPFMRMNSVVNVMRSHDWVSLSAAQAFVASHNSDRSRLLGVFLSDDLTECFQLDIRKFRTTASNPSSLASSTPLPTHKDATPKQVPGTTSPVIVDVGPDTNRLPWEQGMLTQNSVDKHLHIIDSRAALALPSITMGTYTRPIKGDTIASPLSPQEQDVFQSLCQDPDLVCETVDPGTARQAKFNQEGLPSSNPEDVATTENESPTNDASIVPEPNAMDTEVSQPKLKTLDMVCDGQQHPESSPLRRSKRAATAVANQRILARPRRRTTKHF